MPGRGLLHVVLGVLQVVLGQRHLRVAAAGLFHPAFRRSRLGLRQRDPRAHARQLADRLAGDLPERGLLDLEVAAGGDDGGVDRIAPGLGIVGVGDVGIADIEVAACLLVLLLDGIALRKDQLQRVLGVERVEVSLRRARDQVLLRLRQAGFRGGGGDLALLVGFPAVPAEQRLRQR